MTVRAEQRLLGAHQASPPASLSRLPAMIFERDAR
jgi:hypothetical protein